MREAQYHSAATSQTFPSTPTQLDPGSLLDSRRGGGRLGGRNGANTLLKQAIANRLKETPTEEEKVSETKIESKPVDKNEMEMSRSIVGNPAWYRDDEGKTGFKPREWENLPNQQKDQVKKRKEKRKENEDGLRVEQIDEELLNEKTEEEKKKMEEEEKAKEERKLSKEEKKELKKKEKEDKKREKEEKKEEKKKEREEKKRLEKEEKERKKSQTSLDKVDEKEEKKKRKEREKDKEEGIQEGTMEMTEKRSKEKRDSSKERGERKEGGEKRKHKEGRDRSKERKGDSQKSTKIREESPPKFLESPRDAGSRRESTTSQASSSKSTDTVRHQPGAGKPPRHPPLEYKNSLLSSPSSSNEEDRSRTVSLQQKPKKQTIGDRRDSSMSESSRISGVSHKSVTFNDRVQTHEIERIIISSSEEDDVGVMSDDELSKPDSERRRRLVKMLQEQEDGQVTDSDPDDFEEQERLIEQQLIEQEMMRRHQALYPIYNLEETTSQDSFYPEETDPDRYLLEDDGSYISLDKLPAAVRRAIIADMGRRARDDDHINMGSMSKLHEENYGQLSPQNLPRSASGYLDNNYMVASYQQAMYGAFHHDNRNSSHPQDSKIQEEIREQDGKQTQNIHEGYWTQNIANEKKEQNLQSPGDSPSQDVYRTPRTLGERRQQHNLHESFYDNVPSRTSSLIGVPSSHPSQERRGSDSKVSIQGKQEEITPVPSPPRRESSTSIERRAFFESMNPSIGGVHQRDSGTPTPSPPRVVVTQSSNNPQRVVITTTTTSMLTNRTEILEKKERNEEEMRRKFLKQFGGKKAPKAEEEDPLDPGPTSGSQESVYSTDSRESVVSEASIRKENFVRRNFNY